MTLYGIKKRSCQFGLNRICFSKLWIQVGATKTLEFCSNTQTLESSLVYYKYCWEWMFKEPIGIFNQIHPI